MPKHPTLPIIIILLIMPLAGCAQRSSPGVALDPMSTPTPTATFLSVDTYQAYPSTEKEVPAVTEYPYPLVNVDLTPIVLPTISPTAYPTRTSEPTPTPTLFALNKPLPAPLYFISIVEGGKPQVWRLEQEGSKVTKITQEEEGVIALDVAQDGRLAYLSNNALIVTDAWGSQREVLVQGDPLPFNITNEEIDEKLIRLTTPVWSPDGILIAFCMGETWLANPVSGHLIRVTEERSVEQRLGGLTYVPVGWTLDGEKIILRILPPRYGHGGDGSPWGLGFVDPQPGADPINPGGYGCHHETCEYSLLKNGQVLLGGVNGAGLWMVDPKTGQRQNMLPEQDPQKPPNYPTIRWPNQSSDHRIFFFHYGGTEATPLMSLAYLNEKSISVPYPKGVTIVGQMDELWMNEALWSADARMVLIGYGGIWQGQTYAIYQMSTLDGTVTQLNVTGYNLRWGK